MSTVLVIDDDYATGKFIEHIVTAHHLRCFAVSTAEEGLLLTQEVKPTTIFVDLQLNGRLSGWEAIQIFKNDVNLQAIHIIAISAGDHFTSAMKVGSNGYLQKPFTPGQILNALK